jgi:UDP-glucose 4-epimerase
VNLTGLLTLLAVCRAEGIDRFVFSSSAATYGLPDVDYVREDTPFAPMSPYGETKLVGEWVLRDCATAFGLRAMVLRYFNVAGAARPELGDPGAFNLVPLVFAALDRDDRPRVFGMDYPTPDGTCIRDYVHVADVAEAHLAAVRALDAGEPGQTYNIGRGEGASVLEVLRVIGEVTGLDVTHRAAPPRPGDPARVVAAVDRIRHGLGFQARYGLVDMVSSAWDGWRLRHPR